MAAVKTTKRDWLVQRLDWQSTWTPYVGQC